MENWGMTQDNKPVGKLTLKNKKGTLVTVITYGAVIQSIKVADRNNIMKDVVLGYDNVEGYEKGSCYFGTVVGRNCNRIDQAQFALDGVTYKLPMNDGTNNLHSGPVSIEREIWTVEEESDRKIKLSVVSPDGASGFPGNMKITVTYSLNDENALEIHYEAVSDKKTIANFTNHSYFNLDGQDSGSVVEQSVMINADAYTPVRPVGSIPTGEIAKVAGTPFDLRTMTKIGAMIGDDFDQLKYTGGYDHNFCINGDGMRLAAKAEGAVSGITLLCETDLPGLQLYAGNYVGEQQGKDGAVYGYRHGFCFETQYYPNSANQEGFKRPVLEAGEKYESTTRYTFGIA